MTPDISTVRQDIATVRGDLATLGMTGSPCRLATRR
jgi:hypothetical protein